MNGHSAIKRSIARLIIGPNAILSLNMGNDKFSEGLLDRKSGHAWFRKTTRTPERPNMIHFNQID